MPHSSKTADLGSSEVQSPSLSCAVKPDYSLISFPNAKPGGFRALPPSLLSTDPVFQPGVPGGAVLAALRCLSIAAMEWDQSRGDTGVTGTAPTALSLLLTLNETIPARPKGWSTAVPSMGTGAIHGIVSLHFVTSTPAGAAHSCRNSVSGPQDFPQFTPPFLLHLQPKQDSQEKRKAGIVTSENVGKSSWELLGGAAALGVLVPVWRVLIPLWGTLIPLCSILISL